MGKPSIALRIFDKAIKWNRIHYAWRQKATFLATLGQHTKAIGYFEKALAITQIGYNSQSITRAAMLELRPALSKSWIKKLNVRNVSAIMVGARRL
jgi:tetratricopeptide (TPR) repeat protein